MKINLNFTTGKMGKQRLGPSIKLRGFLIHLTALMG